MAGGQRTLVGLGVGVAAASVATALGVARGRAEQRRLALATLAPEGNYYEAPDEVVEVVADDGVALHVEIDLPPVDVAHSGITVIFSHGFCLSLGSWVLQRRALAGAGHRVVLWDQRSHGRSGLSSEEGCDIDQLGSDLRAVIEAVAPEGPIALVGHSMGGMTMMALADQYPDLVKERVVAAAFVATSAGGAQLVSLGFGQHFGKLVSRLMPSLLDRLGSRQSLFNVVRGRGRELEEFLVGHYSFASPVPPEAIRFTADLLFATPLSVMSDFMPTFDRHDKRHALEHFLGIEVLVLNGMQDVLTPPDHSAEIVRRVPGAEHVVIEDGGHIIMLEHPDVVDEQLEALIERGMRAHAAGVAVERKPRVRMLLTDMAKRRRVAKARAAQARQKP
jgi:pimeloyl-ACP methyl ester carboxylesterase